MKMQTLDQTKAEAFTERMLDILNSGAIALMISIGHRTGLFDTMAELAPSTSQQIADAAGLNERYVREWLGAMVTGKIVEYTFLKRAKKLFLKEKTGLLARNPLSLLTLKLQPRNYKNKVRIYVQTLCADCSLSAIQ